MADNSRELKTTETLKFNNWEDSDEKYVPRSTRSRNREGDQSSVISEKSVNESSKLTPNLNVEAAADDEIEIVQSNQTKAESEADKVVDSQFFLPNFKLPSRLKISPVVDNKEEPKSESSLDTKNSSKDTIKAANNSDQVKCVQFKTIQKDSEINESKVKDSTIEKIIKDASLKKCNITPVTIKFGKSSPIQKKGPVIDLKESSSLILPSTTRIRFEEKTSPQITEKDKIKVNEVTKEFKTTIEEEESNRSLVDGGNHPVQNGNIPNCISEKDDRCESPKSIVNEREIQKDEC